MFSTDEGAAVGAWALLEAEQQEEGVRTSRRALTSNECSQRGGINLEAGKFTRVGLRVIMQIFALCPALDYPHTQQSGTSKYCSNLPSLRLTCTTPNVRRGLEIHNEKHRHKKQRSIVQKRVRNKEH